MGRLRINGSIVINFLIAAALAGGLNDGVTWPPGFTGNSRTTSGVDCYAIIEINGAGTVKYNDTGSTTATSASAGNWLDDGFAANLFWAETHSYTGTPGTLNYADELSTRVQLGTNRKMGVVETTTGQTHGCSVTLDFYDAASGGNLVETLTLGFTAEKQTP